MKKVSILIIDDNEADRYLLKRQLLDTSIDPYIFEKDDGKTGLDFLSNYEENKVKYPEHFPPDIIFLDINMPLLNGWEFLEEMSKLKNKIDIESCIVIMFSSSENPKDMDKVSSFNSVKGYLVKGQFSDEELEKIFNKLECVS